MKRNLRSQDKTPVSPFRILRERLHVLAELEGWLERPMQWLGLLWLVIKDFGTALWWASMMVTTMGSDYWPRSPEGRILTFLLALYAFAIFGYVTATIAGFLIGRDAEHERTVSRDQLIKLERELTQLQRSLDNVRRSSRD